MRAGMDIRDELFAIAWDLLRAGGVSECGPKVERLLAVAIELSDFELWSADERPTMRAIPLPRDPEIK